MIKKIRKLKNLGIFSEYSWDRNLKDFQRFNLIYGWNWSGKTTLSDLFAVLEKGVSDKYPILEYELETETGRIRQGELYSRKVRVFNQDYVLRNVPVLTGKAKHIFVIGEENKQLVEQIRVDEELLSKKEKKRKEILEHKKRQVQLKNTQFTNIATIISANRSGKATRTYRKPNAETAFNQLSAKVLLNKTDIRKHELTLQQREMQVISELSIPTSKYQDVGEDLKLNDLLKKIFGESATLCAQTVEAIIINRLKDNNNISEWVEEGIALHTKHKSKTCEYCNQPLPEKRMKELASHFNVADKEIKQQIDLLISEIKKVYTSIQGINAIDKANLYEELRSKYQEAKKTFESTKQDALSKVDTLEKLLKKKKSMTTEVVDQDVDIDLDHCIAAIDKLNEEIKTHNTKTNNFRDQKNNAEKELEKHYLSTIYDGVKDLESAIADDESELKTLQDGNPNDPGKTGIHDLKRRIAENKTKVSPSHRACDAINENLATFLGRDEIVFETEDEGYVIKRNGVLAENLSEGEKNAITFVYFTVHLGDQDFDIKEGIVVVDDPVSSLDSNSLFQAFAFLKNAVVNAKQVFILTHSFDFLRLLLNWTKNIPKKEAGYYMVKNSYSDNIRQAYVADMDKALWDYESEYHYLFTILRSFQSDGTIAQAYPIPNIARKALETFLMFRVPNGDSQYRKLETLKPHFDEMKLTAIYKFTNDLSHLTGKGFDPALVPETQKNVSYLLEMMEEVFPEHYEILIEEPVA